MASPSIAQPLTLHEDTFTGGAVVQDRLSCNENEMLASEADICWMALFATKNKGGYDFS